MPSRIDTPRIIQPGRRPSRWWWLFALVVIGALAWKMFEFGQEKAGRDAKARDTEITLLKERIETLEQERDVLRAASARHERASQIDQAAVSTVRAELTALQEERSALRQQLEFYKSLVSGSVNLLQITELSLSKGGKGSRFRYAFTVSKRAKGKQRVTGNVLLSVVGQLKGESTELDATALGLEKKAQRMGFRHFQKFEGELKLPAGFIPKKLRVQVKPKGKDFEQFERTFGWQAG